MNNSLHHNTATEKNSNAVIVEVNKLISMSVRMEWIAITEKLWVAHLCIDPL